MTRRQPLPAAFAIRGLYVGTVANPNADGHGHPSVDVPELGAHGLPTHGTLFDFDPTSGPASAGTAHTHTLTGPTFNRGDRVLVGFLAGNQDRPVVLGRVG